MPTVRGDCLLWALEKGCEVKDESKSGKMPLVLGGIAALVIGIVVFLFLPQPNMAPPAVVAAPPAPAVVAEAPTPEKTAPEKTAQVPEFDIFRVEPDGSMVIAGRAVSGQTVDVILAGDAIDRVVADDGGYFVSLPIAGPAAQPRRLSLLADPEGVATASTTSFMVAPIAEPVVVAQAPVAPAQQAPAAPADDAPSAAAPQPLSAPTPDAAPAAPVAPTVLQADAGGVRVVQNAPTLSTPEVAPNVALDAITYDPDGKVQLSGRAMGNGAVQVYIDNSPVIAAPVTEGGDWQLALPDVETGVYTLRIDEVNSQGGVVSRVETPFRREAAADVAAVLAEETSQDGFEVAVRTVQPGATLWAIAEENLGNGIFYVQVFEANRDLIRDPDLIYPGQIFRIPQITQ